tara:strand:- start:440 stop:583 length:144 start_codon:yes stop_codon:yes gene_type:complete
MQQRRFADANVAFESNDEWCVGLLLGRSGWHLEERRELCVMSVSQGS